MAKRVVIGDIFRIKTKYNYGYIQYIHKNDEYGYLIRLIKYKHGHNDDFINIKGISKKPTQLYKFFPLQSAFNASDKKSKTDVHNPIELILYRGFDNIEEQNKFPTMIAGMGGNWRLYNGIDTIKIQGNITDEHRKLSIVEIINYETLIYWIDNDYSPESND